MKLGFFLQSVVEVWFLRNDEFKVGVLLSQLEVCSCLFLGHAAFALAQIMFVLLLSPKQRTNAKP